MRSGVALFGGDWYLGGVLCRWGDSGPAGDMTMGDIGAKACVPVAITDVIVDVIAEIIGVVNRL